MKRLLLIDAYAFIYRAYYAFSKAPMTTSKGMNTAAIYGFIIALEELLRLLQPTHLAVAFGHAGKPERLTERSQKFGPRGIVIEPLGT